MSQKPRAVLMLLSNYPPTLGGTERQAQRLAGQLSAEGRTVIVLTQAVDGWPAYAQEDGVAVYRIGSPTRGLAAKLSRYARWLGWLWHKRQHYDLIHAHQPFSAAYIGALMGLLLRKPLIVKIPSNGAGGSLSVFQRSALHRALFRLLAARVACFVSVNEAGVAEARALGVPPARVRCIPNGINTAAFPVPNTEQRHEQRQRLGIGTDDVVCVYTGRLAPVKQVDYLVDVCRRLQALLPERLLWLLIVGDGPEYARIAAAAADQPRVQLYGHQATVWPYLAASDYFLFADRHGGLPNALLEAMSTGLVVAVSAVAGNTTLIQDGHNGTLLPLDASQEAADRLASLMQMPGADAALGAAARVSIEQGYSIAAVAAQYDQLYRQVSHP